MTERIEQAKRDLQTISDSASCGCAIVACTCGFSDAVEDLEALITDLVAERDEWEDIARVLADTLDRKATASETSEQPYRPFDWLTWARDRIRNTQG